MLIKRLILKKLLSSGGIAEFLLVKREGEYEAALFINGRYIPGLHCRLRSSLPRTTLPIGWVTGQVSV